jgi:hypothetical protein
VIKQKSTVMHLLHARTGELREFHGYEIPAYAILSHVWEEGEVTYQDMQASRSQAAKKAGFSKISQTCRKALRESLEYAWVDTCCIDKSSSAELTEAINSMFRWYQKAETCYVYLADVPARENTEVFERAFASSRWFTRGWTLQELLAPRNVCFYSSDWTFLGTKMDLCDQISEITTINTPFLRGVNVQGASVAKRMSWASERETTRVEDISYCLLGIFGVHMPMLYGEGQNAFRRLQKEIIKVSNDQSLFAWSGEEEEFGDEPEDEFKDEWDEEEFWHKVEFGDEKVGLLAESPFQFRNSGNIVPYNSEQDISYAITNTGLRIALPLSHFKGSAIKYPISASSLVALACHIEDNFWDVLVLPLLQLTEDRYVRLGAGNCMLVPRDMWMECKSTVREITILTDNAGFGPPVLNASAVLLRLFPLSRRKYKVYEYYPDEPWREVPNEVQLSTLRAGLLFARGGEEEFILRLEGDRGDFLTSYTGLGGTGAQFQMTIASRLHNDVKAETILRRNTLYVGPKFTNSHGLSGEFTSSHKLNGETFDVTLFGTVVMGEQRFILEVDIWSEEQMSSEQIQQIRDSRRSIR